MKRSSLAGLGVGLFIFGAVCAFWARSAYASAEIGGQFSAALEGAQWSAIGDAGSSAGMRAAMLPGGIAALALLAGTAILIAAAVRRS